MAFIDFIIATCAIIALGLSLYTHKRQISQDRAKKTQSLYQEFFQPQMLSARGKAWFFIQELKEKNEIPSWKSIWSDKVYMDDVCNLYLVLSFWHSLRHHLEKKLVDNTLVIKLFSYEWEHWKSHMKPLVNVTGNKDDKLPEAMEPFQTTDWFPVEI